MQGEHPDPAERLCEDDQAARAAERFRLAALAAVRPVAPALVATGVCRNCAALLEAAQTYCDADCRADHQRRQARGLR